MLKSFLQKFSFLLFVSLPMAVFGANDSALGKFKGEFETQVTNTASDIAQW